jgi:hypothetical protein
LDFKSLIFLVVIVFRNSISFGQSDAVVYQNLLGNKVVLINKSDSLWLKNPVSKKSIMTYVETNADYSTTPRFIANAKFDGTYGFVKVRLLNDSICDIYSDISDFNFGLCKIERQLNHPRNGSKIDIFDFVPRRPLNSVINKEEVNAENIERRMIVNHAIVADYDIEFDSKLSLKLSINSDGDVVSAVCIKARSTFTDQKVIDDITSRIVQQMKYSKSSRTEIEY